MTDDYPIPSDLRDLPIEQMTITMARNAPACRETDALCLKVMGWEYITHPDRTVWHQPDGVGSVVTEGRSLPPTVPTELRVSRDGRAAHMAREWLRNHGLSVELHDEAAVATREYTDDTEYGEWPVFGDVGEHLLSARLLLTLYAEDVL